jgi:hypothetical protein
MIQSGILLFLGGVDTTSLAIVLLILAIAGFFLCRMLLKYLFKKGQTGINIAAFMVGSIQAPVILAIAVGVAFWIGSSELPQATEARANLYDSMMRVDSIRRAADIDVVIVSPINAKYCWRMNTSG